MSLYVYNTRPLTDVNFEYCFRRLQRRKISATDFGTASRNDISLEWLTPRANLSWQCGTEQNTYLLITHSTALTRYDRHSKHKISICCSSNFYNALNLKQSIDSIAIVLPIYSTGVHKAFIFDCTPPFTAKLFYAHLLTTSVYTQSV
jgi:hypothetical protein